MTKRRFYFIGIFILIVFIVIFYFYLEYYNSGRSYDFYETHYSSIVAGDGVMSAFVKLKDTYKRDVDTKAMCHQITHIIGRAATKKYADVDEAFKYGDSFCWSGYYHGVMEGIVSEIGLSNLTYKINSICSNIKGKEQYSFDYYNCVHGLGHGIMYINSNEIFDALKICDYLDGLWEQKSCYGGVFMENIITDDKNHFTKYLKDDDVYYPCNVVEDKYAYQCYFMQTSRMLDLVNWDFSKVFDLCEQLDERFEDTCYQSIGRDASGYTESDAGKTRNLCMLGKNIRQKSNCIVGAVKDFIAYFHTDREAKRFCESLQPEFKKECLDIIKDFINTF